jgi:hypothetical protein
MIADQGNSPRGTHNDYEKNPRTASRWQNRMCTQQTENQVQYQSFVATKVKPKAWKTIGATKFETPSKRRPRILAQIRCNKTLKSKQNEIQSPSIDNQVKKQPRKRALHTCNSLEKGNSMNIVPVIRSRQCGSTDFDFFCSRHPISIKTGNLKFSYK